MDNLDHAVLDAFPTPWRTHHNSLSNRTTIAAANGMRVLSGMNTAKAEFIVRRVNAAAISAADGAK